MEKIKFKYGDKVKHTEYGVGTVIGTVFDGSIPVGYVVDFEKAGQQNVFGNVLEIMPKPKFKIGEEVVIENGGIGVIEDLCECYGKWRYKIKRPGFTTCTFEETLKPVGVCFKDGAYLEEQYAEQVKQEREPAMRNPEIPDVEGFKKLIDDTVVNHPPHYTAGKIECIDALEAATTGLKGIEAVCTANAIKYLWRWKHKNGVQDLQKAQWYINKLIEVCEEQEDD